MDLPAYFARQAGHCLELLAGGGEETLRRPEVLEQRPLARGPDPGQLVEDRALEHAAVAAAAVVVDREAVRLVADLLQQARGLRVGGEVERLGAAGDVDLLQPLGEADDGGAALGERRQRPHPGGNGGPDDFASMEEVLERRVARYLEQIDLSPHDGKRDESFASLPSLLMIDGGKGQLAAGMKVLQPFVERGVTVVSLAKKLEEVYVPGRSTPLDLAADSEASKLLQRVRDEAHRFAIDHHRGRRDRAMTGSVLDELKGIGPARKRALLQHFGSPERFLLATREELEAVPGLPGKVGREIHEQLNRTS